MSPGGARRSRPRVSWLGVASCALAILVIYAFLATTEGTLDISIGRSSFGFGFVLSNPMGPLTRYGTPAALVAGIALAVAGYRRGPERVTPILGLTLNTLALVGYAVVIYFELRGQQLAG